MKKADLISGDFEDNTMTFEIEGDMILKAGKYIILTEEEHKNLSLSSVSKRTFRKAKPSDIVVGNTVYLLGDGNEIHTQTIDEVLRPDDMYKAYVASDGCRYGLDGLYVC